MSAPLFSQNRRVLFQEIDAAGIVFFARFFEWFHDAYACWFAERGLRFAEVIARGDWGVPLVHAEADYREPLLLDAQIRVEIDSLELGDSSMTIAYSVRGAGDAVHATGRTVHVFIDRASFRKRAVPDEVRRALKPA